MLTTHIKARKYFWGFLSFANFYFLLDMQIFMDFIVTPKLNKGQSTLSKWENVRLIAKINFFLSIARMEK